MTTIIHRAAFVAGFVWELRWPLAMLFLVGMGAGLALNASPDLGQ